MTTPPRVELENSQRAKASYRIRGLDAIRYVCAAWVALRHLGPALDSSHCHTTLSRLGYSLYEAGICGPAAVIVFFVISGLCIHFPYRYGAKISYASYYMRRYVRIGIPLLVALALSHMLSLVTHQDISLASVIWSLIAEVIYYTIYPILIYLKNRVRWRGIVGGAFIAAYAIVLGHPALAIKGFYPLFGWQLTWVLGLPCWLLGCILAERLPRTHQDNQDQTPSTPAIWLWRFGVWLASCIAQFLQFHQHGKYVHFGYSLTLDLFAILVYYWLHEEISYFEFHPPFEWLERAGAASYSLYLVHPLVVGLLESRTGFLGHGLFGWLTAVCGIVLTSAIFYLLVERPSHLLARRIGAVSR